MFPCGSGSGSGISQYRYAYIIGLLLAWLLAGCAVDPRNQADADRTRILAAQQAASLEAARTSKQIESEQAAAERTQTAAARVAAWNRFYFCASIAACIFVLALSSGAAWAAVATGQAAGKAAQLKAYLIPLPEHTRQYPLLLCYLSRGKFSLNNPNNGSTMLLDTRQPADRELLRSAGVVQLAGIACDRRSCKPGDISIIPSEVSHG